MKYHKDKAPLTMYPCLLCLEKKETQLKTTQTTEEENKGPKDTYQMEQDAQEMEARILQSLTHEEKARCWYLVSEIQSLAERWSQQEVKGTADQSMLYNILIAEAWKAAKSYDPEKPAKFSTWVYKRWRWALNRFRKVNHSPSDYLSDPPTSSGGDCRFTLGDRLCKDNPTTPGEYMEREDLSQHAKAVFKGQPLMKIMIEDICKHYEWLCPFCRRALRSKGTKLAANNTHEEQIQWRSAHNVYARRKLWQTAMQMIGDEFLGLCTL